MKVMLKNYRIDCSIGINKAEKESVQPIFIDIEFIYDAQEAVKEDSIEHAINYEEVGDVCKKVAVAKHYGLLETLAVDIVEKLFKLYPLKWAKIIIKKPKALKEAEYAAVEWEKTRINHGCC